MHRIRRAAPLGAAVALALTIAAPAMGADREALNQYVVSGKNASPEDLSRAGYDVLEGSSARGGIAIVATRSQARKLRASGAKVVATKGQSSRRMRTAKARGAALPAPTHGFNVFRPWSLKPAPCPDTCARPNKPLKELYADIASSSHQFVDKHVIGKSVRGQDIVAYRVSGPGNANGHRKPAVLFESTQHAREWIATEVEYRLFKYVVGHARDDSSGIPKLLSDTELWFIPVVNPDGYDWTFTSAASRLWRKNLRDVDGDGAITGVDGVDPNRNWPTHWNFDLEGSSANSDSETYHGSGPASEPEVKAARSLIQSVKPKFMIDYHSFAQLILYPFGFQVETPATDSPLLAALAGDDDNPAVAGFDPDVSAELYITNGDVTDDALTTSQSMPYTVELDGGTGDPVGGTDGSDPNYKPNGFVFQDSEAEIQAEFEKNLAFALDLAKSAKDPDDATSHLGNEVPDMVPTTFDTSDGAPQTVEVNARRSLGAVSAKWSINGGPTQSAATSEWGGGSRYGDQGVYFHKLRGQVTGAHAGDQVKVWFTAGSKSSASFTYTQRLDSGADVLLLAAEDATGNSSDPPSAPQAGSKYVPTYTQALSDAGRSHQVWDIDANGRKAPSALGVLSHYKAVLWETGDDLYTREPTQPGGTGVSKLLAEEVLAVRDFINEGGKLIVTGKHDLQGSRDNFLYNPLQRDPGAPFCASNQTQGNGDADDPPGQEENCVPVSNDFLQYWLGAYLPISLGEDVDTIAELPFLAVDPFGSLAFKLNGDDSAKNQNASSSFVTTSSILPASEYPQFASKPAVKLDRPPAFDPPTGSRYAVASSSDESYQRLRKTIDLTGATAADLQFKLSFDTEPSFDYVFVEAHTIDASPDDDWTTLPDANGNTSTDVGASCDIDWNTIHPFLDHYQSNPVQDGGANGGDCTGTGSTGSWNAATGNSGGFRDWKIDLSAYAGKTVEVSITYAQDFAADGLGVFLDDLKVTKDGSVTDETSFEDGLGGGTAGPPPAGTENQQAWESRTSVGLVDAPGVATDRTVLWGFGLEGVTGAENRAKLLGDTLHGLGVG
jgi:hypothetical protein